MATIQSSMSSLQSQIYQARQKTHEFNKNLLSARKEEEATLRTFEDDRAKWTQSFEEKNVMIEQLQRELEATVNALHTERSISHTPSKYSSPAALEHSLSYSERRREVPTPSRISHHYTDYERPLPDTSDVFDVPRRAAPPPPASPVSTSPAVSHTMPDSVSASQDLLQLVQQNDDLKTELETMKKAWRESETHLKHRTSEVKELNLLLESSHAVEADLRIRINTFEKLHETATVNMKTLRYQLEQQAIENTTIQDQMRAMSQEVAHRDRYIHTLEKEVERLKSALADSEAAREAMAAEDREYTTQLEQAQKAVMMLSRRLTEESLSDGGNNSDYGEQNAVQENEFYVDDEDEEEENKSVTGHVPDKVGRQQVEEDDEDVMTQLEEDALDESDEEYKGTSLLVSLPPQASPRALPPGEFKIESAEELRRGSESFQEALRTEAELQKWIEELKASQEESAERSQISAPKSSSEAKVTQYFHTPAGGTISSIDTATVSSSDKVSIGSAAADIRQLQKLSPVDSSSGGIVHEDNVTSNAAQVVVPVKIKRKVKTIPEKPVDNPASSRTTRKASQNLVTEKPKRKITRSKSQDSQSAPPVVVAEEEGDHHNALDDPTHGAATRSILDFTVSSPPKMFVRQNAPTADTTNVAQSMNRKSTRVSMERAAHEFLSETAKQIQQAPSAQPQQQSTTSATATKSTSDVNSTTKTLKVRVPSASGQITRMRKHVTPAQSPAVVKSAKPLKRPRGDRDNMLGTNLREVKGYVLADKLAKSGKDPKERRSIESEHANDVSNISLSSDNHKNVKSKKATGSKASSMGTTMRSTSAPPRSTTKHSTPQQIPKVTSRAKSTKYSISPKSTLLLATSSSRGTR